MIESRSVQWIDHPSGIDRSFLDEVPLIPEKAMQGNMHPLMGSAVDKLFASSFPESWALFVPFPEYHNSMKRLFMRQVLSTFDPDFATERLDNFFASSTDDVHEQGGDKLYAMLDELTHLNQILEEIYLRILSCLKP